MQRFRVPLIATAIIGGCLLVISIVAITMIFNSEGSSQKKAERAGMVGGGVGTLGGIAIAPFWIYAAAKIGQERRRKKK